MSTIKLKKVFFVAIIYYLIYNIGDKKETKRSMLVLVC